MERRELLKFLGIGAVSTALLPPFISACSSAPAVKAGMIDFLIQGISPSTADDLVLAPGLTSKVLIAFGDAISDQDSFGFNNDYTAFIPTGENEGLLWVNHEYVKELFVSGFDRRAELPKSKEQADKELYAVGGSILKVKKANGEWTVDVGNEKNRRVNGHSMIPFNWSEPIAGKTEAMGTFQNCSGGLTPWGTILTCEENYQHCYGECSRVSNDERDESMGTYGWSKFYDNPPQHYGWVVEVDPQTGESQKHVALGRFCHECATVVEVEDKKVVVYTGDDDTDEHMYKFISSEPGSLKNGILYAADTINGKWLPLDYASQPILQENFKDQTEVLIFCREAAKLLGATPLARPEDIEVDPVTGHVLVALTNDKGKENYHGEIMKIEEDGGDYRSLSFKSSTFLAGGVETGFSCPDNMAFDHAGNLWFTSDISGSAIGNEVYSAFGHNGLFIVPRTGEQAGQVIQMASAPVDAEFTGPFFCPDKKTLFLSVQHPGERTKSLDAYTSKWPHRADGIPRSSVVCITGETIEKLQLV